jgi:hypothetical protein
LSGGKDSTVLGYVMRVLDERYGYGLEMVGLSVDEGIEGYRDWSLEVCGMEGSKERADCDCDHMTDGEEELGDVWAATEDSFL